MEKKESRHEKNSSIGLEKLFVSYLGHEIYTHVVLHTVHRAGFCVCTLFCVLAFCCLFDNMLYVEETRENVTPTH